MSAVASRVKGRGVWGEGGGEGERGLERGGGYEDLDEVECGEVVGLGGGKMLGWEKGKMKVGLVRGGGR